MKAVDRRLKDHWQFASVAELTDRPVPQAVAILSYPDDEGVRNNKGRPGARQGPERLLYYLGRFALHSACPPVFVVKDVIRRRSLAQRHARAEELIRDLLEAKYRVVSLGGGHDYGFPDASAFYDIHGGSILNVDAHLDVRPLRDGKINSGTPFRRWVERYNGRALVHWGLQVQSNAIEHIAWAKKKGVRMYGFEAPMPRLPGKVGLSVCLDAFAGIRAVSAPAMVGLSTAGGLKLIKTYASRAPWLGIYECAPALDRATEDSARYGALLIYHYLYKGKLNESRIFS